MGKFDPIDIFFISIISAYFITLLCIIITIIYLKCQKLVKKLKAKKLQNIEVVKPKTKETENIKKKPNIVVRTLFMKKVKTKEEHKITNDQVKETKPIEKEKDNKQVPDKEKTNVKKTPTKNTKSTSSNTKKTPNKVSQNKTNNSKNKKTTPTKKSNNKTKSTTKKTNKGKKTTKKSSTKKKTIKK